MSSQSSFRFAPALESLGDRLNPSSVLPADSDLFVTSEPRLESAVAVESRVLAAEPSQTKDDVYVDGKIITAENYDSATKPTAANDLTTPEPRPEYLTITFSDVLISSYQSSGSAGG